MPRLKRFIVGSVVVIGVALVIVGGLWAVDYFRLTRVGEDYPPNATVAASSVVSEKRPDMQKDDYSVAASQPRKIGIPAINVEAYIQRVGVTPSNDMATPNNLFFAGWYNESPSPGSKGVSIINGHAGGRYTDGIFRHLNSLNVGSPFRIQMGDLSWRNFEVTSIASYSVKDAADVLYRDDRNIEKEVHLITCDGIFDDATKTYDKRVVVVAKRVE